MRVLVVAALALLALPTPSGASGGDDGLLLYVRVEGAYEHVFHGWVRVPPTLDVTTYNNGHTYTIPGTTPLAALVQASRAGGFEARVTDEYLGIDFSVDAVDEDWQSGTWWWDYRVNYVSTYYGIHRGWLEAGPGLRDGDEVLWYLETIGSSPIRLRASPLAECAHTVQADMVFPEAAHRPGQPWPTPSWAPLPQGVVEPLGAPVLGGRGIAIAPGGGADAWVEWDRLPAGNLNLVRSDRVPLPCGG